MSRGVTEFDVIARGVNRLSENVDEARARQEASLQQLAKAVNRAQQSDRETRAFYETATREIADPVMQVVEQLKLNQQGDTLPVDPSVILHNAERVKLSVLAMLGKLEEAQAGSAAAEVDINEYFGRLATRYLPRFARKGLAFHVNGNVAPSMENIRMDAATLDIVLEKLLENALAFTPEGEVRLRWKVHDSSESGSELVVSVRDNGQGIAAQDLEAIFDRYAQFTTEEGRASGSGLGLYIARELLLRQGGNLNVVSQRGVGSEFTVHLPVTPGTRPSVIQSGLQGRTALTVGIERAQYALIESSLAIHGVLTQQADTAIEALAFLANHPVDLIWVDEAIEDIDVESFLVEAKKRREGLRVVILSESTADASGGVEYLQKPVERTAISTLLSQLADASDDRVDYRLIERLRKARKPEND